jgi:hypothetical protein
MKKLLLTKIIILLFSFISFSQNCVPVAIVFSTQAQIDAFPTDYPGCTIIDGNVGITGSDITNLNGLSQITIIKGSLQLLDCLNLQSLAGLQNLESIGGTFKVNRAPLLSSISQLTSFQKIGGSVEFENLPQLSNFSGFDLLDTIPGGFIVRNCSGLNSLMGLEGIKVIGESLVLDDIVDLMSLSELSNLEKVGLDLIVQASRSNDLTKTTSLIGLNNVTEIGGDLTLLGNITEIESLNKLSRVSRAYIADNYAISELKGFNELDSVIFTLDVFNCSNLVIINAFSTITFIDQLRIIGNPFLSSIAGFDHKIDIEIIEFAQNSFLQNCDLISICEALWKGKQIFLSGNSSGCNTTEELTSNCGTLPDSDSDGINDFEDNCPSVSNPDQSDCNFNGIGDVCDSISDSDNDTIFDDVDNCPCDSNPNQSDANNNGIGDICDFNSDTDSDGTNDPYDNCPNEHNPGQEDFDNNGIGDVCDDSDSDGVFDLIDNCRDISNSDQMDYDSDGIGDVCDNCPGVSNVDQSDCNNNGIGDACDTNDSDCDGIPNNSDNCPDTPNIFQTDLNNNGIGDACEDFPRIGINNLNPKTELHLSNGSLYIDNPEKGVIMKDHQGNCFIVTIDNGSLMTKAVDCPQ